MFGFSLRFFLAHQREVQLFAFQIGTLHADGHLVAQRVALAVAAAHETIVALVKLIVVV